MSLPVQTSEWRVRASGARDPRLVGSQVSDATSYRQPMFVGVPTQHVVPPQTIMDAPVEIAAAKLRGSGTPPP
jgi:hypothetical protein